MHAAAAEVRKYTLKTKAINTPGKIARCLKLIRRRRGGYHRGVRQAVQAYPLLGELFDTGLLEWTNWEALHQHVDSLMQESLTVEEQELNGFPHLPNRDLHIQRVKRPSQAWARTGKRIFLKAVLDPEGCPHSDPEVAAKEVDLSSGKELLDLIEPIPQDPYQYTNATHQMYPWEAFWDQFRGLLKSRRGYTAGPDGLPFSARWNAGEDAQQVLYDHYLFILRGGKPVAEFNHSRLGAPPRGDVEEDGSAEKDPAHTRPLALSNTDTKIVAALIAESISRVAEEHVGPAQRGF
eukprot:8645709-Pyramimonas_sp.AAC.1